MVLLALYQCSCISQAVRLLKDCDIPEQVASSHEDSVGNQAASERAEWNGISHARACSQAPLVLKGVARGSWLEAAEVEGDLTGVGPERWHCDPA